MKTVTAKQAERLEKKKKKLAALTEIIKLNDKDRRKKETQENSDSREPSRKRIKSNVESIIAEKKCCYEATEQILDSTAISQEKYVEMKKSITERKRSSNPKFRLKLAGDAASLEVDAESRTPIFLTDIQNLIMSTLFPSSQTSRFIHIEKSSKITHTTLLVLEGMSLYHYSSMTSLFKESENIFAKKLEIVMPSKSDGKLTEELATVPITELQREELTQKYGSIEAALDSTRNQTLLVKSIFPFDEHCEKQDPDAEKPNAKEILPRTQLLLSALQMVDEGYPLPLQGELANRYKNFVYTKDEYIPVTATSPMFGLDCEMCLTSAGCNELTRISIVNEKYESVYETLVCPKNKIVNYLTEFSGITKELMLNVTKTLQEVQNDVRAILPADAILVGQSLHSDLLVMRMMHPYIIDTSVIFNISGERKIKSKLQTLSFEFLGEVIQNNPLGHDSIEDCAASLKLTHLKLTKGINFGDAVLSNKKYANERNKEEKTDAMTTEKRKKSSIIITTNDTNVEYKKLLCLPRHQEGTTSSSSSTELIKLFECDGNKHAIKKTQELAIQHDLTITHLKIDDSRLEENGKLAKTVSTADRWISNVWSSIAPNSLFIVLLGGNVRSNASGVALLSIKRK